MYSNLIFDLDDTILKCGIYYAEAKKNFIDYSHTRTEIPVDVINKILNEIDLACMALPLGFNKERFPRSFAATSATLDIIRGETIDESAAEHSYYIGHEVFNAPYEMFDGARKVLEDYKNAGKKLFLCTKGDMVVQKRKIVIHNLLEIFGPTDVYIVPKKTPQVVKDIVLEHLLVPKQTIFIGDSLRDDVNSALSAGIDAVWVNSESRIPFLYETNTTAVPTYTIDNIAELPTIIPV